MSKYPNAETTVLKGILAITQANQGRRTTVYVKKVQRYGGIDNLPPTIIGKSLAQLERRGILESYFIGSRRIYLVNLTNLVKELARANNPVDKGY